MNSRIVELTENEVWPLLNVLNEVCYGINVINFELVIGVEKEVVIALMDKITQEDEKQTLFLNLNKKELMAIEKSFEEVLRQIDQWELQTRIGISRDEINKIKEKFQ